MSSRFNEEMVQPHTEGVGYPQPNQAPPEPGGEASESKELTAGYCCIDALLSTYPDKKNDQKPAYVSGTEKLARYELSKKIQRSMEDDTDVLLTGGEQQKLMALMEEKWSTDIYGQCHKIVYRNEPDVSSGDSK